MFNKSQQLNSKILALKYQKLKINISVKVIK